MKAAVEFPAASVLQHVAAVHEASGQMAQARSAVREVTMDSRAYGELCQFLPGLLSPLFGSAVEVLTEVVEALSETGLKLHATVRATESADAGSAHRLTNTADPGRTLPL